MSSKSKRPYPWEDDDNKSKSKKIKSDSDKDGICIIHDQKTKAEKLTFLSEIQNPNERIEKIKSIRNKRLLEPPGSSRRLEEMCRSMPEEIGETHGYHPTCYKIFTRHIDKLKEPVNAIQSPSTRNKRTLKKKDNIIFNPDCIFCNSEQPLRYMNNGSRVTEHLATFDHGGGKKTFDSFNQSFPYFWGNIF
jgi:hypothetical protein